MLTAHNTFTYLRPKQWWLRPFSFVARCQSRDYATLFRESGVTGFDIRLWWDKHDNVEFRHGIFAYDASDLDRFLIFCDQNHLHVRVSLECRNKSMAFDAMLRELDDRFVQRCRSWKRMYPNIHFYGGRNMGTWELLYDFGDEPKVVDIYASRAPGSCRPMQLLYSLWPWLWAKCNNSKYDSFDNISSSHHYYFDFL